MPKKVHSADISKQISYRGMRLVLVGNPGYSRGPHYHLSVNGCYVVAALVPAVDISMTE